MPRRFTRFSALDKYFLWRAKITAVVPRFQLLVGLVLAAMAALSVARAASTWQSSWSSMYWSPLLLEVCVGCLFLVLFHFVPGRSLEPWELMLLLIVAAGCCITAWTLPPENFWRAVLIELGSGAALFLALDLTLKPRLEEFQRREPADVRARFFSEALEAGARFEGQAQWEKLTNPVAIIFKAPISSVPRRQGIPLDTEGYFTAPSFFPQMSDLFVGTSDATPRETVQSSPTIVPKTLEPEAPTPSPLARNVMYRRLNPDEVKSLLDAKVLAFMATFPDAQQDVSPAASSAYHPAHVDEQKTHKN
jgi:hypothetical protein